MDGSTKLEHIVSEYDSQREGMALVAGWQVQAQVTGVTGRKFEPILVAVCPAQEDAEEIATLLAAKYGADVARVVNLAEKALVSAKAARLTTETREKVSSAVNAPPDEREPLLVEALASAVEALDALTEVWIAAREEAAGA